MLLALALFLPPLSDPAATVGGETIPVSVVMERLWASRAREAAREVAFERAVRQAADKAEVKLDPAAVELAVTRRIEELKGRAQGQENADVPPKALVREAVETELRVDAIALKGFDPKRFVRVSTFGVRPKSDAAEDFAKAIQTAQGLYDRLKKGEAWETVIQDPAVDARFREGGGALGWRARDLFPEPVRPELDKPGVVKPVKTAYGIQIFRVEATGATATPEDIAPLRESFLAGERQKVVQKILQDAKIELKIR